jgi:hypothetical protein
MALTRQAIEQMRRIVDSWSASGDHHRTVAPFVAEVARYFDAEEERSTRLLPAAVLADGIALQSALEQAGLSGEIAELIRPDGETPGRYRIAVEDEDGGEPLRLEGTVAKLTSLLVRMAG